LGEGVGVGVGVAVGVGDGLGVAEAEAEGLGSSVLMRGILGQPERAMTPAQRSRGRR
jgi:hypothetical protein